MTRKTIIWGVMVLGCTVQAMSGSTDDHPTDHMSKEDREVLKEEARDMFYHAYNAYMDNAYPADELMPLSCKGRYRGSEPDRGDIETTLGNFSLTLVDSLDTLVVLGDLGEFENAVRLVVKDVTFDTDVIVSLFETNIRMLGGLLSGHILAEYLQSRADIMPWYRGELLNLAKDLGYRFLPAFNTTTGIPFGRINLRHGMKGVPAEMCRETCTACAGSMILEMAALSRLTGESIFEDKAQKAMDALWKMRHRGTDLMGSVLNVHSGDWVRRDSGVGAGIDSYYEYCLKAYILLGDEKYLGRFNKHYQAVMKYVSQGPMLLDVHMHRPNTNSKNFMDALLAFWPGLQVLKGDIKPAVETHEMLYQVLQRHNFIPEAFTTDFQVHWGHHPLRPEFLESTYFLYRATGDHYYLGVGRKVLKSLQTYARVPCGYAAVSDVRTNKHDDTMESFVLSETLKYLYLLFAEPNDLVLDIDEFIFTTEGHLLPLTLAAVRTNVTADLDRDIVQVDELGRTCPNSLHLFPASVRQPLRNMVEDVCPRRSLKRRLNASQFQANNMEHLKILSNMGITILTPAAGRIQVLHKFSNARTAQDAEEGLLFMQEIVELSKKQSQQLETRPQSVTFVRNDLNPPQEITLLAGPAHFGPGLNDGKKVTGEIKSANPSEACDDLIETEKLVGKIVMVLRGNCMFVEKARRIQKAGAIAGIVLDTVIDSSAAVSPMFAMSGDGREPDDVTIPVVFLFNKEATELIVSFIANEGSLTVTIGEYAPRPDIQLKAPDDLSVFERLKGSLKDFLTRQITPQNSEVTNRPSGIHGSSEIFDVTEGLSGYKITPFEYKISDHHLKAVFHIKTEMIELMKTDTPPPLSTTSRDIVNFDIWHDPKQDLVNEIYTSEKSSALIPLKRIQFLYSFVQKRRGLPAVTPVPIIVLIEWFLKEFTDIGPNTIDNSKLSKRPEKERKLNDEESTKANLEAFLDGGSLDVNILQAINAMTKNENIEKTGQDDSPITGNLDDIIARLSANEKLKNSVVDELKDALVKIFNAEYLDLEFSRMDDIVKSSESSSSENNVDSPKDNQANEETIIVTYGQFRGSVFKEKGILKIEIMGDVAPARKRDESINLENFERTWYDLRRYLVSSMYSHNVNSRSIEIFMQHVEVQYHTVRVLRGHRYDGYQATLENMIMWYLKEISEIEPDPDTVESLKRYYRIKNNEKTIEKLKNAVSSDDPQDIVDEDVNEEKIKKNRDYSKIEFFLLNEIEKAIEFELKPNEKKEENDDKDKNENETKNHSSSVDEDSLKIKSVDDSRMTKSSSDITEKLDANNDASRFSVHSQNVERSRDDEIIEAGDPLEEFKKPVWAPDDGKDSTKSFTRFRGKSSDLSNANYEYPSVYTRKMKNVKATTRQGSNRIEDEL